MSQRKLDMVRIHSTVEKRAKITPYITVKTTELNAVKKTSELDNKVKSILIPN